jgi:hypothetical protein
MRLGTTGYVVEARPTREPLNWRRRLLRVYWSLAVLGQSPLLLAKDGLLIICCRFRTLYGIRVGVLQRGKAEETWRRVESALGVISRHDPRRLHRLRSDFARILVVPGKHAYFSRFSRSCVLNQIYVDKMPSPNVASVLVHEATHARLRSAGLTAYGADLTVRVEELCVDEEIAFAMRCPPDGFPRLDEWLQYLHAKRRTYPGTQAWPPRRQQVDVSPAKRPG